MPRITKSLEERKQEIIDAASNLFCTKGYDKTMIIDIARELNIAQGLIYHYFESKVELLYAVVDKLGMEQVEKTKDLMHNYNGSAFDCLALLFKYGIETNLGLDVLTKSLKNNRGIIDHISRNMLVSVAPVLEELIERGNDDGSWHCEYPSETAKFVLHGISGSLTAMHDYDNNSQYQGIFKNILLNVLNANDRNAQ